MRQAREEMLQSLSEHVELDEAKMSAAQIAKLKKAYEPMRGKKISMTSGQKLSSIMDKVDDDKQALIQLVKADIPFVSQLAITRLITKHGMKGAEIRKMQEEVELDEASYALYHKDFSSAMQHSYKMAKKMYGITIDPKEIDDKVASGPKKPSEGKTNKYRLKGDKGAIQVQVYNKGGSKPFELNMYKEEVELDEVFDFVLLDKDNKIARRYSGSNAKKDAESGKKSAHLPPMSIPKGDVKKMKIVPIAPKDKKGIGDTVLAIGEKLDKEDEPKVKEIIKKLKGASQAHAGQAKDLEKAVKEDSKPINEILPVLARMVARKAVSKVSKPQEKQEGFASDAQRRAAFASGYKEKGKRKDESAASDARRAMASDPSTKQKFSKNVSATDDDVKAADKNIIMQMRKAVSLRGNKVEFMDKKKVMIPQKIAQAVIAKYNNMKKPADKEKFQSKISKSYKSMLATLKEQNEINNKNNSLDQLKELVKEMKGKNNG